ncbi:phage portal protein [Phytohabitans sp. ZYX-F-186]|uniref:Phage portal protein n=1 Tax=Phytohabitans maris TaxID=3071409 RepID=A0ABU0ZTA4_9ACTN|nr:phage portal protein [Phytohabitans sp. ZYX-F-186]MDQ7910249.1 phage portal protein [Phytohabitans sp. ZYX-F-186]
MRSLLGTVVDAVGSITNRSPVPYVSHDYTVGVGVGLAQTRDRGGQLAAMSGNGTVFSIVDRLATSTAAVDWHMHRTRIDTTKVCPICEQPGVVLVKDHLALRIWNKPSDFFTRQELVEAGQQHFDLTGETWLLVERDERMRGLPLGLWTIRPDRIDPVPSKEKFLVGYIYKSPDGQRIPLDLDEVIQIRRPDPEDPYRGLGAIQAALRDVDSANLAAQWNRNFFLNSAEPGGMIKTDGRLDDDEWNQLRQRWNEQHKGVSRAHRVAILEGYEWIDRKYTNRDMQLTELRILSRDMIREAYGIAKFALGDVDDVNRATAEASKAWFAESATVPRLDRWKQALNNDFLPLFGSTGSGVEFAYGNPVPPDEEAENAARDSKTSAWATLVTAGADPDDAADVVGLPRMRVRAPQPVQAPAAGDDEDDGPDDGRPENAMRWVAVARVDDDTCQPCEDNDGKTYRNRAAAYRDYPGGSGYRHCEGRGNCRCRVVKRGRRNDG